MNEPVIHLSVIDPEDQKRQKAMTAYLQWLQKKETAMKDQDRFTPLKPRVTRENLYNL